MNINVIKELSNEIPVNEVTDGEIDPILWCRDGEYRVVSKKIIQNAINVVNSFSYMSDKIMHPKIHIGWSQGIPISNLAGRALIGE